MSPSLAVTGAAVLLAAGLAVAQGKHRDSAHTGPYRVVISKPLVGIGYTAGTLYREQEYLGAMFNQLAREGLEPVMSQIMTQTLQGQNDEQRLLVVCRTTPN